MIKTKNLSPSLVRSCFQDFCKSFNTTLSHSLVGCSDVDVVGIKVNPKDYVDHVTFRKDYLLASYLSKYKGLQLGIDTKKVAIQSFYEAEALNLSTNDRLKGSNDNSFDNLLFEASRIVMQTLGVFSFDKVLRGCTWGPGATFDIRRSKCQVDIKVSEFPLTTTAGASLFFERLLLSDLHWSAVYLNVTPSDVVGEWRPIRSLLFNYVEGNKVTTVSKNAKTDRVIAMEPTVNGYLQKGVGLYIRNQLKRVCGIDLNDQSVNQTAAKRAYDYALATIDLKMASDTVAIQLVKALLPPEWFDYLMKIRSAQSLIEENWHYNQKFSSMGNGFTFELESLIFFSLAEAVRRRTTRREEPTLVYGDDIIVPRESAPRLIELLSYCGLTVNTEKSFIDGDFFESCGKHFFKGFDVTPIYQKEIPDGNCNETIRLCNRILRIALRWGCHDHLDRDFKTAWRRAYRSDTVSPYNIPLGCEGDDGYLAPKRYFTRSKRNRLCRNRGIRCEVYAQKVVKLPAHPSALLAYSLRQRHLGLSSHELEFFDEVSSSASTFVRSYRWVMPTEEFTLDWN